MICPACIAEDVERWGDLGPAAAYGRTAWLMEPIHTCPKHNFTLVEVAYDYHGDGKNGLIIHDLTQRLGDVNGKLGEWIDAVRPAATTPLELYVHRRLRCEERGEYDLKLKREFDRAGFRPVFDTAQVPATFYLRDELLPP